MINEIIDQINSKTYVIDQVTITTKHVLEFEITTETNYKKITYLKIIFHRSQRSREL
jgi:hypothetical protein